MFHDHDEHGDMEHCIIKQILIMMSVDTVGVSWYKVKLFQANDEGGDMEQCRRKQILYQGVKHRGRCEIGIDSERGIEIL